MAQQDSASVIGQAAASPKEQTALTAENAGTVNSGDATTDLVIEASRTRLAEIETILQKLGHLPGT